MCIRDRRETEKIDSSVAETERPFEIDPACPRPPAEKQVLPNSIRPRHHQRATHHGKSNHGSCTSREPQGLSHVFRYSEAHSHCNKSNQPSYRPLRRITSRPKHIEPDKARLTRSAKSKCRKPWSRKESHGFYV